MTVGRAVAAPDLPAREAHAQVHPAVARLEALLAARHLCGHRLELDLIEMCAGHSGHRSTGYAPRPAASRRSISGSSAPAMYDPSYTSPSRKIVGVPRTPLAIPVRTSCSIRGSWSPESIADLNSPRSSPRVSA